MERECVATDLIEPFICSHTAPVREDVATLALRVQVIGSMQTPADLVVSACQTADIDCTSPVVQQKDANQSGELRLEIPFDFAGYLEFQASDAVPSYYFTNRPLHDLKEVLTILMITPELVRAGAMLTGAPAGLDQNNFVGVQMRNCAGAAVGGVQFETSKPDIVPLYIVNGLPTPDATVTAYDPVSQMAVGGFLNVAPGFVLVKARLGNSGPIVGQLLVNIRTDSLTQLDIYP